MIMAAWQGIVTVLMAVLGTIITRFLPFVLFPESKKPPRIVDYLGNVLPYAMTGLLVVYSLKNVNPLAGSHGIPEAIAIVVIVILHIWKRSMLLSIAGGTAIYIYGIASACFCFIICFVGFLKIEVRPPQLLRKSHAVLQRHHANRGLLHLVRKSGISRGLRIQTIQNLLNMIESANAGKITAGLNQTHTQITRLNTAQGSGGERIRSDDTLKTNRIT